MDKQIIKETIENLNLKCGKIESTKFSGGVSHIEIEVTSPNPQEDRKKVEEELTKRFPKLKFRLLMFAN